MNQFTTMAYKKKSGPKKPIHHYARVWVLLGIIVIGLGYGTAMMILDYQKVQKVYRKQIYGTWVEQNVADYAADHFTIKPKGVFMDGRQVSSKYSFDGVVLTFTIGGEEHRFEALNASMTKMKRTAPAHYESIFINTNPPESPSGSHDLNW